MANRRLYVATAVTVALGLALSIDVATDRGAVVLDHRVVSPFDRAAVDRLVIASEGERAEFVRGDDGSWWLQGQAPARASDSAMAALLDELAFLRWQRSRAPTAVDGGGASLLASGHGRLLVDLRAVGDRDRGYQWVREQVHGVEGLVRASAIDSIFRAKVGLLEHRVLPMAGQSVSGLEVHARDGGALVAGGRPLLLSLAEGGKAALAERVRDQLLGALEMLSVKDWLPASVAGQGLDEARVWLRVRLLGGLAPLSMAAGASCPADPQGVIVEAPVGVVCVERAAVERVAAALGAQEADRIAPLVRADSAGLQRLRAEVDGASWEVVSRGAGFQRSSAGDRAEVATQDLEAVLSELASVIEGPWRRRSPGAVIATLAFERGGRTQVLAVERDPRGLWLRRDDEPIVRAVSAAFVALLRSAGARFESKQLVQEEAYGLASYRVFALEAGEERPILEVTRGELLDEWSQTGSREVEWPRLRETLATLRAEAIVERPAGRARGAGVEFLVRARFDPPPLPGAEAVVIELRLWRGEGGGCLATRAGRPTTYRLAAADCDLLLGRPER